MRPSTEAQADALNPAPRGAGRRLFGRGVSLHHFIVFPTLTMALLILFFRWLDSWVATYPGHLSGDFYQAMRTIVISSVMVSVIGWLVISHRRQYEARLKKRSDDLEVTRDFLSSVIETSGEAIITLDAGGRTISWNRSAETIFGWSSAEMTGETLDRLLPSGPEHAEEQQRITGEIQAGRTMRHFETTRVNREGTEITVHITQSPLHDGAGRFAGSTLLIHDVTELKRLEALLVERERLAALGELAAAVAHEVKNPLAGIRGACDILARGYGEEDRRYELGQEVIRQVDRLTQTVRDLLGFARPKDKKPIPTDIHTVLERVLGMMEKDPENSSIEVIRRYDRGMPPLRVDPQQMEQVFFNILVNARQAMNDNGRMIVSTLGNHRYARISIRDSGKGIPAEAAEKIFDPFFTTRTRGTGLGLAIVKKIVGAHAGEVSGANPEGGGAEITVSLPLHAEAS